MTLLKNGNGIRIPLKSMKTEAKKRRFSRIQADLFSRIPENVILRSEAIDALNSWIVIDVESCLGRG